MKIVNKKKLYDFQKVHACARSGIQSWLAEAVEAHWRNPTDIKSRYSAASFLPSNMVIFNLKGNSYRLEIQVAYDMQTVFIKWIGTHAEYDKRNKAKR